MKIRSSEIANFTDFEDIVVEITPEEYTQHLADFVWEDMAFTFQCTCEDPVHDAEYVALSQSQAPCFAVQAMGIGSNVTTLVRSRGLPNGSFLTYEITTP